MNIEERLVCAEARKNYRGWILITVALSAGCGIYYVPKKTVSHSYCKLSQQDVQKICLLAAQDKKLISPERKPDEQPASALFRFNYPVQMPSGEIAAETFCDIDAAHNAVVDAQLLRASKSSAAADYLHNQGLCSEWNTYTE